MRHLVSLAALAPALALGAGLAAAPLAAQAAPAKEKAAPHGHAAGADPDHHVAGGALPAGWSVRPDGKGSAANVKVAPMGKGLHLTLGPATLLYRDVDSVTGRFHTLATFTQTKAPTHPEGYGLFAGGKDLQGAGQAYIYFLVRGDGTYLIKQRVGDKTTDISKGWVASPAVSKADAAGKATNKLEIDGKAGADNVRFSVNGQVVHTAPAGSLPIDGVVGIRANHNLDIHVDGFDIHRI